MKKVLLISANRMKKPYAVYPLGLDYVAGCLHPDYETRILDLNALSSPDALEDEIRQSRPDYIGLSIRNIDNTDTINRHGFLADYAEIMKRIRQASAAPVILGGSGYTVFPLEFLQALGADYGIAGEGERLPELLAALDRHEDPSDIPGVVTPGTSELRCIPWKGRMIRRFDPDAPHIGHYLTYGGMLNLQTKRGCPFRCSYCTYPYIEGAAMRFFDAAEIASQARALQDAGAKYIFVTDSAFNASYDHSAKVARAFIEAGLSIPWGGFFAPTEPPADYYRLLADAGLTHVEFGTESMCDKMLKNLRKPFTSDEVLRAHGKVLDAGLFAAHYFLLGGPGENSETLSETLLGADRLDKAVFFFFCGIRIYPHTSLYETALAEGQIAASDNLLEPVFYRSPFISDHEIVSRVEAHADGRLNWLIGAGESKATRILPRLYERGHSGPLWEHLIP